MAMQQIFTSEYARAQNSKIFPVNSLIPVWLAPKANLFESS